MDRCCVPGPAALLALLMAPLLCGIALAQPQPADDPPNIVFILTDDEDLGIHAYMPKVRALIEDEGTVLANFFVTYPLCCPSRASILRGQYPHNTRVVGNRPPKGGFLTFRRLGLERSTIATWLKEAGYRTAFYGKYMNGYTETDAPPPGWDEWHGVNNAGYFNVNYKLNENGNVRAYGDRPEDYLTDVIAGKAVAHIRHFSAEGRPFFLFISPTSPHSPFNPAPRHHGMFQDTELPRPPSFNEEDVSDKPSFVAELPRLRNDQIDEMQTYHRRRIECLQAVDEMVETVVSALRETGELASTYVVYTSDNGFHRGQHRLFSGKETAYEEDIRVPFAVRGPGVAKGRKIEALTIQTDIAATFADWAGIETPHFVDGRSLVPLLAEPDTRWRNSFLVQRQGRERHGRLKLTDAYAIRTSRYTYIAYGNGEREMYDLRRDPHQLQNIERSADRALAEGLITRLTELRGCRGQECRDLENMPVQD